MKIHEVQPLNEVAMTPNALKSLVAKIPAKAGMEFEMYVPDVESEDDGSDFEPEPDYGMDERTGYDIDGIIDFFSGGDGNMSRRDLQRLRNDLDEAYMEWRDEAMLTKWHDEGKDLLKADMEEDFDQDEAINRAMNDLGFTAQEKDDAKEAYLRNKDKTSSKEMEDSEAHNNWLRAVDVAEREIDTLVDEEWTNEGSDYERVKEKFYDDGDDLFDVENWLDDEGYNRMSDIENNFTVTWPHYTQWEPSGESSIDVASVADEFSRMIDRPVNHGAYHQSKRAPNTYNLEPDGSLDDTNDEGDAGLEFISPPLSLVKMISDLHKIKNWADRKGCYTNESTGLHINVSVPGVDKSTMDYVKLVLLLGDNHILEQFERQGNTYCRSALDKLKEQANNMTEQRVANLFDTMRQGLDKLASESIHSGDTQKFVSVNNKGGYVEFRSPGGDWLDEKFDLIENTLYRAVVALDAAGDPQKYRKEYMKKLYKLLAPKGGADPIAIFAKYASGDLTMMGMKNFIRTIQNRREAKRTEKEVEGVYSVTCSSAMPRVLDVHATSPQTAKMAARMEWELPDTFPDSRLTVVLKRRDGDPKDFHGMPTANTEQKWQLFNLRTGENVGPPIYADSIAGASIFGSQYMDQQGISMAVQDQIAIRRATRGPVPPQQNSAAAWQHQPAQSRTQQNTQQTNARRAAAEPEPGDALVNWTLVDRRTGEHLGEPFQAPGGSLSNGALATALEVADELGIAPENHSNLMVQLVD
jgi:hypothetical protein